MSVPSNSAIPNVSLTTLFATSVQLLANISLDIHLFICKQLNALGGVFKPSIKMGKKVY